MKLYLRSKSLLFTFFFFLVAFLSFPSDGIGQEKLFEVFGDAGNDYLGSSILCRDPGIHAGAPGFLRSSINGVGKVNVYDFNSESLLYSIDYPITPSTNHNFGHAMISIPDTNSNSIREIAISAPGGFLPSVILFDEGSSGSTSPIRTFFGQVDDGFGTDLALIDYPPRDGVPELVVAAPARTPVGTGTGEVDFVDLSSGSVVDSIPAPSTNYDSFGASIARMPDINGNGSDEIAIGAPGSLSEKGAVLVYSLIGPGGGPTFQLLREIQGLVAGERIGQKIASIPDISGDGKEDLVIAGPGSDSARGLVRVYSGAELTQANPPTPLCEIVGENNGENLGASLAGLGDLNGDGRGELAVGMPGFANGVGKVLVYQYSANTGCQVVRSYEGSSSTDEFGRTVFADSCPVVQPGAAKLMVGTSSDQTGTDAGSAIIFSPPPTVTPTPTPTSTPIATATPLPPPRPSKASLTFRISESGEFKIVTKYDQEPDDSCSSILYGRINVGSTVLNLEKLVSTTNSTANTNERETVVRILNFPRAAKVDGKKPIINMGLRTTCDGTTFDSNVFARYMNCGVPDTAVSLDEWMNTLKQALGRAGEQASVRSDRNVKVVRLKKRRHKR